MNYVYAALIGIATGVAGALVIIRCLVRKDWKI